MLSSEPHGRTAAKSWPRVCWFAIASPALVQGKPACTAFSSRSSQPESASGGSDKQDASGGKPVASPSKPVRDPNAKRFVNPDEELLAETTKVRSPVGPLWDPYGTQPDPWGAHLTQWDPTHHPYMVRPSALCRSRPALNTLPLSDRITPRRSANR